MTVSTTDNIKYYTGNDVAINFTFNKKIFEGTTLVVKTIVIATGVITTQTKDGAGTYDFSVVVAGDNNSATITLNTILPSTHRMTVERILPLTDDTDYSEGDDLPAETLERNFNELLLMIQQIDSKTTNRSFQFAETVSDIGVIAIALDASDRASKVLAFDANGDLVAETELGTWNGTWATATAYVARDLIKDTTITPNAIYRCNEAHTSTGTLPISTNADAAKWDLVIQDGTDGSDGGTIITFSTAADPTANSDSANTDGNGAFSVTSTWVNTTTNIVYVCVDATPTSAIWAEVIDLSSSQTLASKTLTSPVLNNPTLSVASNVTADVGSSQGDGAITTDIVEISTCANAGDAVTLPTAAAGKICIISNNGANSVDVFPASGDAIDGASVDTAYALASGSNAIFACQDGTDWDVVATSGSGGGNVKNGAVAFDQTTATGTTDVSSLGFDPTHVILFTAQSGGTGNHLGFWSMHGTLDRGIYTDAGGTLGHFIRSNEPQAPGGAASQSFSITMGTDKFTLNNTKTGSPTGTIYINWMAFG